MDYSTPGFPVLYHIPELAQIMSIEGMKEIENSHFSTNLVITN